MSKVQSWKIPEDAAFQYQIATDESAFQLTVVAYQYELSIVG